MNEDDPPITYDHDLAAVVLVVLVLMNRNHIYSLVPYLLVGAVLWYCVFMSGVHSTIAGVLLAFVIPSGSRVNLKSFITWSGDKVREARDAFQPETPVIAQGDYIKTAASYGLGQGDRTKIDLITLP